jgi:hypothetical protein
MKKVSLIFALALITVSLMATSAMADILQVSYNTSVQNFTCSPGVSSCGYVSGTNQTFQTFTAGNGDTVKLTYYGVANAAAPTFANAFIGSSGTSGAQFGSFGISTTSTHEGLSTAVGLLNGATWQILIAQNLPTGGSGILTADLSGTISVAPNGQITFTFANDHVQIGAILYQTAANTFNLNNSENQLTSINGNVSVPEPASLALLGSGMLMGGNFVRRKIAMNR